MSEHAAETQRTGGIAALGGKAAALDRLARAGMPVPPFAVLDADLLRRFRREAGLDARIEEALRGITAADVDERAARVHALFRELPPDAPLQAAVAEAYESLGAEAVAVRSSGVDEDSATLSFAGQFASFLNVRGVSEALERVVDCWASAYSPRALAYRLLHSLPLESVDMAVLIQAMVDADKSGVMFTANPTTGRDDELVVSAVYGLGEGLVSGELDADTVVVDKVDGRVKRATAAEEHADADRLAVDDAEIAELYALAGRLERLLGGPQDIEWSIADGKLWLLQSRPITTPTVPRSDELRVWDNSNIIESYGDVTAPLTFSFARHIYHHVYRDYCGMLGVPRRQLDRMDDWLRNMLGYFNGRVYYNILNWYKVIRLSPGYELNRRVLELQMGMEALDEDLALRQQPLEEVEPNAARLAVRAGIVLRLAWYMVAIDTLVERFIEHFYEVYEEFDAVDYERLPAEEVYRRYCEAERRLLHRWGRIMVLEAVIALSFGALHVLTSRWLPDAPDWVRWGAVRVDPDVESTEPSQLLDELAELVRGDERLARLLAEGSPEMALERLRAAREDRAAARLLDGVEHYLRRYGDRSANELKLEEPGMRDDPSVFFSLLQATVERLARGERPPSPHPAGDVDEYLDTHLRGVRRLAYELVRRRVRHALTARERVRFCRTRIFGLARRMFGAIGADLVRVGAIARRDDVFFARLEELRGCFEGTIGHRELAPLVELRRRLHAEYAQLEAPARFTTRGSIYWGDLERGWGAGVDEDDAADGDERVLRGTPCSPGTVTGVAHVTDAPRNVGGDVLVAYRTDPGWGPVLPSASGLLIERGSPLTHVAVVARELGIPTIVQIRNLTKRVRTGMRVHMDGSTGVVRLGDDDGS